MDDLPPISQLEGVQGLVPLNAPQSLVLEKLAGFRFRPVHSSLYQRIVENSVV